MSNNNGQLTLVMKKKKIVEECPFYFQNSFSKKNWDSTFLQTEELYAWNLSKCSKSRLPMRLGIGLNLCKCWFLDYAFKRLKDSSEIAVKNMVRLMPRILQIVQTTNSLKQIYQI